VTDVQAWDRRLAELASPVPLLQSHGWGAVQEREGWHVERVDLGAAAASVQVQGRGRLRRAYVPRGPLPATAEAVGALAEWARSERLSTLRVEPEAPPSFAAVLRDAGFRPARAREPRHTLIVDLLAGDELLASFKPKHRYNVRLAERRGVVVEEGEDAAELERQAHATASRQGIVQAGRAYYERRLALLPECRIYVARHEGEALAAIMVARHDGRAYYLYGGSSGKKSNLMPTYALQFAAMQAAVAAGCREYDLWGIPPADDPGHPWHGLWQFKTGFGGRQVEYVGAWELVLDELGRRAQDARDRLARAARALKRTRIR
jgi:peptidoglycan biosynthesis/recognition FemAB-like protein